MNKLLAAILLLVTTASVYAEPHQRTMGVICASKAEVKSTVEKYGEEPIYVGINKENGVVTSLWANLKTGTSSWITQVLATGEWCMIAVGLEQIIPEDSPLKNAPIGTRTTYK
jgi:hypothetical protein